jgi:hypothetical protein
MLLETVARRLPFMRLCWKLQEELCRMDRSSTANCGWQIHSFRAEWLSASNPAV